jgi:hypothetical protein
MRVEVDKLEKAAEGLTDLREHFEQTKEKVDDVQEDMHDCLIPNNVDKRGKELEGFSQELYQIKQDLVELKKADEAYTGSAQSEHEIARQIKAIKEALAGFEQQERDMADYLKNEL